MFAIKSPKFAAFAIAASLIAAPAAAQSGQVTINGDGNAQTALVYGDLNLVSAEGQQRLTTRIEHAADAVCGVDAGSRDLAARTAAAKCRRDVIARTRQQISPAMAANTQ